MSNSFFIKYHSYQFCFFGWKWDCSKLYYRFCANHFYIEMSSSASPRILRSNAARGTSLNRRVPNPQQICGVLWRYCRLLLLLLLLLLEPYIVYIDIYYYIYIIYICVFIYIYYYYYCYYYHYDDYY